MSSESQRSGRCRGRTGVNGEERGPTKVSSGAGQRVGKEKRKRWRAGKCDGVGRI